MSFTADLNVIVRSNSNGLLSAHPTWQRLPLSIGVRVLNGFPFDSSKFGRSEGSPLIRIRDILMNRTETRFAGAVPEGYWIEDGDILIGMDGDFKVAWWKGGRALLNQRVCKLVVDEAVFEKRFIFWCVGGYLQAVNEHTPSITVKHLSSKTISQLPAPVPPRREQQRIAEKLDTLFARVDACRDRLARAEPPLKRFRQSVLVAATSGQLTQDWRCREQDRSLSGWQSTSIGLLSTVVRGASPRPAGDPRYFGGTCPWITVGELTKDERKLLCGTKLFVTEAGKERSRYIAPGTLLLTNSGATLGVPKITQIGGCINDGSVALLGVDEPLRSFLYWLLRGQTEILRSLNQGAAQPNLNTSIVKGIAVNLPPAEEQAEIVRRVELLFAHADRLEARLAKALAAVDRLTPALLAKAFRGELVPQDPNDEPASEMLKRLTESRQTPPVKARRYRATLVTPGAADPC